MEKFTSKSSIARDTKALTPIFCGLFLIPLLPIRNLSQVSHSRAIVWDQDLQCTQQLTPAVPVCAGPECTWASQQPFTEGRAHKAPFLPEIYRESMVVGGGKKHFFRGTATSKPPFTHDV